MKILKATIRQGIKPKQSRPLSQQEADGARHALLTSLQTGHPVSFTQADGSEIILPPAVAAQSVFEIAEAPEVREGNPAPEGELDSVAL
jgi:hypothetical protein